MKLNIEDINIPAELLREQQPGGIDTSDLEPSIASYGDVYQAVLVRKDEQGQLQLVAGRRRLLAAERVGLKQITAVVSDLDEKGALRAEITENLARKDLPPHLYAKGVVRLIQMEMAEAGMDFPEEEIKRRLWKLANERKGQSPLEETGTLFGSMVEDLFAALGKSLGHFTANILPATGWPDDIRQAMEQGLSRSAARTLAQIEKPELRQEALKKVLEGGESPVKARASVLEAARTHRQVEGDMAAGEALEAKTGQKRVVEGWLTPPPVLEWPDPAYLQALPWDHWVPEMLAQRGQPGMRVVMLGCEVADVDRAYMLGAQVWSVSSESRFEGEHEETPELDGVDMIVMAYDRQGYMAVSEDEARVRVRWLSRQTDQARVILVPMRDYPQIAPLCELRPLAAVIRSPGEVWIATLVE